MECIVGQVGKAGQAEALARLAEFRRNMYDCFDRWADALFEITDALAGADRPVRSIAELSLEPVGSRGWGSFYQGLNHGTLDESMARDLLAEQVCATAQPGKALMFAVDTSIVPRPDTTVVAEVGMQYAARGSAGRRARVEPGWSMSWVAQVGQLTKAGARTSWGLLIDPQRVRPQDTPTQVAIAQVGRVAARLPAEGPPPLFLFDPGYCAPALAQRLAGRVQMLVRLRSNLVLYGRPPVPAGRRGRGRPRCHGARFAFKKPDTWGPPQAEARHTTADGAQVWTRAWHHKHLKNSRGGAPHGWSGVVEGSVIRQETTKPGGRTLMRWLWWAGPPDTFDLGVLADAYSHRFTIEHVIRFSKQDLFWTGHTPLDPAQAERWAWIVALADAQLHLARPLVAEGPRRWEKRVPAEELSPRRVRRDFRRICAVLPSPAELVKNHEPGTGRPKGSKNKKLRARQPVICKGKPATAAATTSRPP
jgi:hypothetical protein